MLANKVDVFLAVLTGIWFEQPREPAVCHMHIQKTIPVTSGGLSGSGRRKEKHGQKCKCAFRTGSEIQHLLSSASKSRRQAVI